MCNSGTHCLGMIIAQGGRLGCAACKRGEARSLHNMAVWAFLQVQELQGHTGEVLTAAWSPDAEHLASR